MDFGIIVPKLLMDFGTWPKITNGFLDYSPKITNGFWDYRPKFTNGFWEAQKTYRILGHFYPQNY